MVRYYPVSPRFWDDAEVKGWGDATRIAALYVLTCPHRNLEGLYRLPLAYVANDLRWSMGKVGRVFTDLIDAGFIKYDENAEVIFVRNALKYQSPKSPAQVKGALAALAEVPNSTLSGAFEEAVEVHAPTLAEAIRKG